MNDNNNIPVAARNFLERFGDKAPAGAKASGALVGEGLLGSFYPVVQKPFGLPPLKIGTGEG